MTETKTPLSATEQVNIMGLDIARLTEPEVNRFVIDALEEGHGGWVCPVNLDVLRQVVSDEQIKELVDTANLVVPDGMPLLWASHIQGSPLTQRVAGSSLISTLSAALGERGRAVYLLGGNDGTAEASAAKLRSTVPGLVVSGWDCPPFGFERSPDGVERIVKLLAEAKPDVVFVGLGFPKQDRLIADLMPTLPSMWFVSCGVSFSFLAGDVRRAPKIIQVVGLEWIYRLMQEPRRLARRYLIDGPPFALRLLAWSLSQRLESITGRNSRSRNSRR
jgi:N-acetylglucosaminyldiphosphoundecaprenol N-acetyl-beta-D-mannosaminyltransferase